jgi:signal recognition particle receptor subunit beta
MALVDVAAREIHAKIVYYGPTLGGKTTNLQFVFDHTSAATKGDFKSIATETQRTLFFDFMPLDLGNVHGFSVRFNLYTVAGQSLYEGTRVAVLKGADGVIFVADAQRDRLDENIQSLAELERTLSAQQGETRSFPVILQYNKMDLPRAMPASELDYHLNTNHRPRFAASALNGQGVFRTLQTACRLVAKSL